VKVAVCQKPSLHVVTLRCGGDHPRAVKETKKLWFVVVCLVRAEHAHYKNGYSSLDGSPPPPRRVLLLLMMMLLHVLLCECVLLPLLSLIAL
jgi:hypothetical protein